MLILLSLFCTKSSDSCDFEAHLTVAKRLYLEDYKKYIEDYLMNSTHMDRPVLKESYHQKSSTFSSYLANSI